MASLGSHRLPAYATVPEYVICILHLSRDTLLSLKIVSFKVNIFYVPTILPI